MAWLTALCRSQRGRIPVLRRFDSSTCNTHTPANLSCRMAHTGKNPTRVRTSHARSVLKAELVQVIEAFAAVVPAEHEEGAAGTTQGGGEWGRATRGYNHILCVEGTSMEVTWAGWLPFAHHFAPRQRACTTTTRSGCGHRARRGEARHQYPAGRSHSYAGSRRNRQTSTRTTRASSKTGSFALKAPCHVAPPFAIDAWLANPHKTPGTIRMDANHRRGLTEIKQVQVIHPSGAIVAAEKQHAVAVGDRHKTKPFSRCWSFTGNQSPRSQV